MTRRAIDGKLRLASILASRRVPCCVIGGTAVALICPDRQPDDLDIVVTPSQRGSTRALAALDLITSTYRCADTRPVLATASDLVAGVEISISTSLGKVDVVGRSLPVGIDRRLLVARRVSVSHEGFRVERASIEDLIDIKEQVARPVDLDDVRVLRSVAATEQTRRFTRWRRC